MKCENCGKETGEDWKKLCIDCYKKEGESSKPKNKEEIRVDSIVTQAAYKIAAAALSLDVYSNPQAWESGKQRLHELAEEIKARIPQ